MHFIVLINLLAQVNFSISNLPIVVIETEGQQIKDEPKITAYMGIISNGDGKVNSIDDPHNDYSGYIGIEFRGSSSQGFPKKQYAVETRDADGENQNVSLLGLPEENEHCAQLAVMTLKALLEEYRTKPNSGTPGNANIGA